MGTRNGQICGIFWKYWTSYQGYSMCLYVASFEQDGHNKELLVSHLSVTLNTIITD